MSKPTVKDARFLETETGNQRRKVKIARNTRRAILAHIRDTINPPAVSPIHILFVSQIPQAPYSTRALIRPRPMALIQATFRKVLDNLAMPGRFARIFSIWLYTINMVRNHAGELVVSQTIR